MEGEEGSASSTITTNVAASSETATSLAESNLDPEVSPVGSPNDTFENEIQPPTSDDDHDHDLEHDHDHDHDHTAENDDIIVHTDDLKHKIIRQVEYYFSDENLSTDSYLTGVMKKNKEGFVPIGVIASFRKLKKLTRDYSLIVAALQESSQLIVSGDGKKVKRLHPFQLIEPMDKKLYTVVVENLPEDHSLENIRRIFSAAGSISGISIHNPHATEVARRKKLVSIKLHALVEYETIESAEKAVSTLNNEEDWRNGMHVKLLKRMGKRGQNKQVWRESNSEKNHIRLAVEQIGDKKHIHRVVGSMGDEEIHNSNEHLDDTADEEGGERLLKDKNGHKSRNRGRSRKHKYHGTNGNGTGHGSTMHVEASKPPPGPRMPDGTRGFAMGRGRPPVSAQS